ncbi:protein ANTAGONIST OF LIKE HETEROCHROMATIN PROTEIN 1-like [Thrips palmi]|uniref:Protein ANTAGONIST OF LIKE HETEROCHROMATIN PROTEIN 1-like n=1 Tax=Thrips palmi TaxID=161013 RepID=A0A6P8Z280_THRPL|nr:protein ANTAGONIST OF LIKE HETEROCHROMATIN PROTEIN 1-like [Thrips palmi]
MNHNRDIMWHRRNVLRRRRAVAALLLIASHSRADREFWVKNWVARRTEKGFHHNLFMELQLEDPNKFRRCLRMDVANFEFLLEKVSPLIVKQDTHLRKSISAAERLSVTLRHLATGETQESLSLNYRLGQSTISGIIKETVRAISEVLSSEFLRFPSSQEEWEAVAGGYAERWNFPHCIGAMDGKHVRIDPPVKSGSMFYNYKQTFSIVLLALVDADLRFVYVDSGANGRASDRGIWNRCTLKAYIESDNSCIPAPSPLPGTAQDYPYVILGDEGFTLSEKLLIPYPKDTCHNRRDRRIFNYRLSRARRCSENAFGVMGARFQILRAPMRYDPDDANQVMLAIMCLHNYLRSSVVGRALYAPYQMLDNEDILTGTVTRGEYRDVQVNGLVRFVNQGGNRHADAALNLRDQWSGYMNTVGAVPWQERMVTVPAP